jgi:hypothetical protein
VARPAFWMSSTSEPSIGRIVSSRYAISPGSLHLPARTSGRPAARHASIARSGPLSAQNRASYSTGPSGLVAGTNQSGSIALCTVAAHGMPGRRRRWESEIATRLTLSPSAA